MSPEMQLLLAAAFFFIYDSAHLLGTNEVILIPNRPSWNYVSGRNGITICGKKLLISHPFALHRPEYRLHWDYRQVVGLADGNLPPYLPRHGLLALIAYSSWLLIFLVFPVVLLHFRNDQALLICAAAIYAISLLASFTVIANHQELGLTLHQARAMALDFVLCPPFTPNIVRRISYTQENNFSLIAAAKRHLLEERWAQFHAELLEEVDVQINEAEGYTEKQSQLATFKEYLVQVRKT